MSRRGTYSGGSTVLREPFGEALRQSDPDEWHRRYVNGLKIIARRRRVEQTPHELEELFGIEFEKEGFALDARGTSGAKVNAATGGPVKAVARSESFEGRQSPR